MSKVRPKIQKLVPVLVVAAGVSLCGLGIKKASNHLEKIEKDAKAATALEIKKKEEAAIEQAKNAAIDEEALVRNTAAIDHNCRESKAVPSLKDNSGKVIVYTVYVCTSIRRVYRMVNGVWTDSTPAKPVGDFPNEYMDQAIAWQNSQKK
jgi:hypothetical protein